MSPVTTLCHTLWGWRATTQRRRTGSPGRINTAEGGWGVCICSLRIVPLCRSPGLCAGHV